MMQALLVLAVVLYTAAAATVDWRMHRIPNWLTVPAAVAGLAFHSFAPDGLGVWMSLAGFAVGFGLLLVPWLCGGGGMGDVKLLAALGALLGPWWLLVVFAVGCLAASLMALSVMVTSGAQRGLAWAKARSGGSTGGLAPKRPKRILPFAVPVALGTWLVLVWIVSRGGL